MNGPSVTQIANRCVRLRCPACGKTRIVKAPFQIKEHCSFCRSIFKREEGFFVGAILVNVVVTELTILAAYLFSLLLPVDYEYVLIVLFIAAILFPVAFYHHSWSIWLSFDHLVESLPKVE